MPDEPTTRPAQTPFENARSSTIVTWIAIVATWFASLLGNALSLPTPPDEVILALKGLLLTGVAFVVALIAARMRDSQWLMERNVTGAKRFLQVLLLVGLVPTVLGACAHYDRAGLRASAAQFAGDQPTDVTDAECAALERATTQTVEGPDSASYLTGRAQTLGDLSQSFLRHSVQCDRAVELREEGQNTSRVRDAFRRSWKALGEIVQ